MLGYMAGLSLDNLQYSWVSLYRGDRYSLMAAITTEGYIATQVVPGSLDSFEFYNFIPEDVVSFPTSL